MSRKCLCSIYEAITLSKVLLITVLLASAFAIWLCCYLDLGAKP